MFNVSASQLNDFRRAAEQAWGDDTRNENYIGHPDTCQGQCFVTSQWLAHKLDGTVGTRRGHYFTVSPDNKHIIDLTGDWYSYPAQENAPLQDEEDHPYELDPHQRTHRAGPVMFKRADHPLYRNYRVIPDYPDHERARLFARRADAALRTERRGSYHEAGDGFLLGTDPYPGSTPQFQEDHKDINAITLHDEPDHNPDSDLSTHEYRFVWANGQLHVSPIHSHQDLAGHAGHDLASEGPFAAGHAEVNRGHVLWSVSSNIALRGLVDILKDYSDTVGWKFDGVTGPSGEHLSDDFGPKKSMYYRTRKDGHLILSERPLPKGRRISIEGKTAYVHETSPALEEWASDFGYKLAEYPGGGNMLDEMKPHENLDTFNNADPNFQPERDNPDAEISGDLRCGACGLPFPDEPALRDHYRNTHEQWQEPIEDGHFPQVEDFDVPLGQHTHELNDMPGVVAMVLPNHRVASRHARFRLYARLFDYDHDDGRVFYGAYKSGQLVAYGAVRTTYFDPDTDFDDETRKWATGGCSTLAYYINQQTGWPIMGWAGPEEHAQRATDPEYAAFPSYDHVFVRHPSGAALDARGLHPMPEGAEEIGPAHLRALHEAEHFQGWPADPEEGVEIHPDYADAPEVANGLVQRYSSVEPEVLMIDSLAPRSGAGTAILRLIQTHFDSFYSHADSNAGERLMRRCGMVQVSKHKWRWAKGQEPKDMIEDAIPLLWDHQAQHVAIGYPGQKTRDIDYKGTPGGVIEGYYEPGGKVMLISPNGMMGTTLYSFGKHWYNRFPQMEITSVEHEGPDGQTTKLAANDAAIGTYVKALAASDPAAWQAFQALQGAGGTVYVVGGAVRDALLGREPKDIDLMVAGLPSEQVAHILGSLPGRVDLTGKRFGVYRYKTKGHEVEIALPRQDKYESSRRGEGVITVDHNLPIETDLHRRDFTANSAAVDLNTGQLIDPYGAADDIAANRLRTTHPDSFQEDPTRLVRALTMHSRYGLIPDEQTRSEMEANAYRLQHESPDALNKTLDKLFTSANPAAGIRLAHDTSVLRHLFPEVEENWDFDQKNPHHNHTLGEHLMHVLDGTSRLTDNPDVRMAALLHDVGKPDSAWTDPVTGKNHYYLGPNGEGADHAKVGAQMAHDAMRRLNYPVARINRVTHLINHHMFPAFNSPKGARKFIQRVGDEHADDLLNLREADQGGKGVVEPGNVQAQTPVDYQRQLVDEARKQQAPTHLQNLAINGNDLIAMGVKPGPQIGNILRNLLDEVVREPMLNNREQLIPLAQQYINAQPV